MADDLERRGSADVTLPPEAVAPIAPEVTAPVTHSEAAEPHPPPPTRRVPDRVLVAGLVLALIALLTMVVVAVVAYRNPDVPPLSLPTASSR